MRNQEEKDEQAKGEFRDLFKGVPEEVLSTLFEKIGVEKMKRMMELKEVLDNSGRITREMGTTLDHIDGEKSFPGKLQALQAMLVSMDTQGLITIHLDKDKKSKE